MRISPMSRASTGHGRLCGQCKVLPRNSSGRLGRGARPLLFVVLMTTLLSSASARAQGPSAGDGSAPAALSVMSDPELGAGFRLLYELQFDQARERFAKWEQAQPSEPVGPAFEAASELFEEFYRKGVLTSEFFLDDKRLLDGIKDKPDAPLEAQFASAVQRAERLARGRLENQPRDPDGLFALTLVEGLQTEDLFLLQRRHLESMSYLREADRNARILLEVVPDADDAYVALGASNYIIGCLPRYKRAMLWVGGVRGDKALGMQQLSRAASSEHARYLRPYARLMLALAALREKNPDLARQQLQELA